MWPLTKNPDIGTYLQVLPIVGIFAECNTRHPSDKKLDLATQYVVFCAGIIFNTRKSRAATKKGLTKK